MHALAGIPVLLEARVVVSSLVVEHHDIGAAADLAQVAERAGLRRPRPVVHPRPDAVGPAGLSGDPVVQLPDLNPAPIVPADPLAVGAIVPVRLRRQRESTG